MGRHPIAVERHGVEMPASIPARHASRSWLQQAITLLGKDLRAEMRSKVALSAIGVFAFTSLLLLALTTAGLKQIEIIGPRGVLQPAWDASAKMGMLWVLLCFAGFAGLSHSFVHEEEGGTVTALRLTMVPEAVYTGKLLLNLIVLALVALIVTPTYMLITDMPSGPLLVFLAVMGSGCIGLAGAATVVAALTARAQRSGALFGAVGLPLIVVLLILLLNAARTLYIRDVAAIQTVKDVGGLLSYGIMLIALSLVLFHLIWED